MSLLNMDLTEKKEKKLIYAAPCGSDARAASCRSGSSEGQCRGAVPHEAAAGARGYQLCRCGRGVLAATSIDRAA